MLFQARAIVPINPFVEQVLGEKSHKSLLDLPEDVEKMVEVVEVFGPSIDVPPTVDQAIQLKNKNGKPHMIWMQLGILNEEAAVKAHEAGLTISWTDA